MQEEQSCLASDMGTAHPGSAGQPGTASYQGPLERPGLSCMSVPVGALGAGAGRTVEPLWAMLSPGSSDF